MNGGGESKPETTISKSKSPESSSDDMSLESHESSESVKSTCDSQDEEFVEDEESDEFAAEKLHIGFFHFCLSNWTCPFGQFCSWTGQSTWTHVQLTALVEEKTTYVDEGTDVYEVTSDQKKMAEAKAYVVGVYCEKFLVSYSEECPNDPVLSDLDEKTGRELVRALPNYLHKLFEKAMDYATDVIICAHSLVNSLPPREDTAYIVDRAKILRDKDLMIAYKKKLVEAAKAEQKVEEDSNDLKSAFFGFCEENYYDMGELPSEDIKDCSSSLGEMPSEERAPYVDTAKKRRVEYHEKAMMKRKLAGAFGLSTSKEDLEMDAYIENWEADKARERKIDKRMEAYKKDNGVVEDDESDKTVFVESVMIHLSNKMIVTSDRIIHGPACGYTFFTLQITKVNKTINSKSL